MAGDGSHAAGLCARRSAGGDRDRRGAGTGRDDQRDVKPDMRFGPVKDAAAFIKSIQAGKFGRFANIGTGAPASNGRV